MNINEFEQKLDYLANNFNALFTDVIQQKISIDFIGSIKNRVITKSEKATGGTFSAYSKSTLKKKTDKGKTGLKNFLDTRQMWDSFKIQKRVETKEGTLFTLKMGDEKRIQETKGVGKSTAKGGWQQRAAMSNPETFKATAKSTWTTNQEIAEKHSEAEGISIIEPSEKEIKVITVMAKKEAIKIIKEALT